LVSDPLLNRLLFFPNNGGYSNFQAASKVFGQQDFNSSKAGNDSLSMSGPHHISRDTDGRLYVADTGNNRVLIFDQTVRVPPTGAQAALVLVGGVQGQQLIGFRPPPAAYL